MPKPSKRSEEVQPAAQSPSIADKVNVYLEKEIESLRAKQATIQEEIDKKNKEASTLRETLLVVNGALQGIQHVKSFILGEEALSLTTSSDPPAKEVS
jgi:uncharacterized protein YlxW (UPF0749 family)